MGLPNRSSVEYVQLQDVGKSTQQEEAQHNKHSWQKKQGLTGWRLGVWVSAITTICVLLINTILTIYGAAKLGTSSGIGTAFQGRCSAVDERAAWLHAGINIIGTLLLTASNYCMQCLAAPTRDECDRAHAKGEWLDIGILSMRNIFKLNRGRILMWLVLALSTVPIHLLYNSTIFKTISTSYYQALVVDQGFTQGLPLTFANFPTLDSDHYFSPQPYFDMQESFLVNGTNWQELSVYDCFSTYATDYLQDYNNVLLVVDSNNASFGNVFSKMLGPMNGLLDVTFKSDYVTYEWLCQQYNGCNRAALLANASSYSWQGHKVAYCLAERPPGQCELQFSSTLLAVVIACNLLKAIIMLVILFYHSTPTLVVLGDAIASFLDRPDGEPSSEHLVLPLRRQRWWRAASAGQWWFFALLCIACLGTTTALLMLAASNASNYYGDHASPFGAGFGVASAATIITSVFQGQDSDQTTTSAILLGNFPQLVMSCAYLLLNALFTVMLLNNEWSSYALKKKPLRVSHPHGEQRSTYWLSLPLRYSVPLLILSAVMHWMISQSLFLIRVKARNVGYTSDVWVNSTAGLWPSSSSGVGFISSDQDTVVPIVFYPNHTHTGSYYMEDVVSTTSALGYSSAPILGCLVLGAVLFLGTLIFGFLCKFKSNMPTLSAGSLTLAASCHPPLSDEECSTKAVQWMEVAQGTDECRYTFTSCGGEQDEVSTEQASGKHAYALVSSVTDTLVR